jgi:site-specific recombinase XerD
MADPAEGLKRDMAELQEMDTTATNKQQAEKFVWFLQAKGLSATTIRRHVYCLKKFLEVIGSGKNVSEASREDLEKAMAEIRSMSLKPETKRKIIITVKLFYKHALGEGMYYPKQVGWIKAPRSTGKKVIPEDLLTESEVLRMLKASKNVRDKAIIALLYDAGIRVGELLSMRLKDVDLEGEPKHIVVNGKTGMRKIPILSSVPYLVQYMTTVQDLEPNDQLWISIGTWVNKRQPIDSAGIRRMLQLTGKAAGMKKRIYPHLFRHSRASYYANRMTEQQLKAFFGWTADSGMASTYVHLSGRDIDNAVLMANGRQAREVLPESKLKAVACPRCREENTVESSFCRRCGSPMDIGTALAMENRMEDAKEMVEKGAVEPSLVSDAISNAGTKIRRKKKENK